MTTKLRDVLNELKSAVPLTDALNGKVSTFLQIFSSHLTQYDQKQMAAEIKRGGLGNYNRLSLLLAAASLVRNDVKDVEDSDSPEAMQRLKKSLDNRFNVSALPPATKLVKQIDAFLASGKLPKITVQKANKSESLDEAAAVPGSELSWSDGDRSAPKTPWGPAQQGYVLGKDVIIYGTAGHGGLRVSNSVANKLLSDAAKKMAMHWGGAYWYEEDVAITVPLYEVEAWRKAATKWFPSLGTETTAGMKKQLERWFPEYLAMVDAGYKMPASPQVGEMWEFVGPLGYGSTAHFDAGDKIKIVKVTSSGVVFSTTGFTGGFRLKLHHLDKIKKSSGNKSES